MAKKATTAKKTSVARKRPRKMAARKPEVEPEVEGPSDPNQYTRLETYKFLFVLLAILGAIAWIGLSTNPANRVQSWLWVLLLLAGFAIVLGRGVTGYWRGILIDSRNKLSLSRLQMLAWSLVVLSAIFIGAMSNFESSWESAMSIVVPSELWVLMGISTGVLVASPAIRSSKEKKQPKAGPPSGIDAQGLIAQNKRPEEAKWADLMMGEELGNCSNVDLGKMQMFFFTFILVVGYAAAIAAMLRDAEIVRSLPKVDEGMNVLLGISQTGYLANKSIAHTPEASNNT